MIKKRVYISVNPILFILLVIDNPPYRSVSKLTSPFVLLSWSFPYFRLPAHCQFSTLAAWASLPNAAILYSKNYALWTSRPYAYGSKRWPFFSVNKSIVHRRSSMSSSSCYAMCVLTLVVLACSIPVKCQTPKLLGTITLLYSILEMGFVITSFQMKDTPVVARCQLPFVLLKLRATEAASCQLRMLWSLHLRHTCIYIRSLTYIT